MRSDVPENLGSGFIKAGGLWRNNETNVDPRCNNYFKTNFLRLSDSSSDIDKHFRCCGDAKVSLI